MRRKALRFDGTRPPWIRVTHTPYTRKNDDLKAIFIHIPKTAGISVSEHIFGHRVGHRTAVEYRFFDPQRFRSYKKFTITRNPWDRFLSAYYHLKRGGLNNDDLRFARRHVQDYPDFLSFLRSLESPKRAEKIMRWKHFRPQSAFICDEHGDCLVDRIGRFETLDDDFAAICDYLGIERGPLPVRNTSSEREGLDAYDEAGWELVASLYREDIKLLGYDAEGRPPSRG